MATIVTRAGKGSSLTNTEVDDNFTNLNTDKIETLTSTDTSVTITGTGSSRNLSVPVNPNVVSGPASATNNAIARFDGTTGKLVKNSVATVSDTGVVAGSSISGASNTLTNIGNAALTNSAITINGTSTALGGSVNVGTVTAVTGTSGVQSSGGTTPAISLATAYGDTLNPYASKTANFVLAAPNGAGGVPTFRAVEAADIPTLNQNTTGSSGSCTGNSVTATTASTANALNAANSYNAVSFTATSDERLKTNWAGLSLDFVTLLADVKHGTFERISDGTRDVGVSAQSLQKIIPETVVTNTDGYLSVNYGGAALVAAIELAKVVEELRAEVARLKAKVGE